MSHRSGVQVLISIACRPTEYVERHLHSTVRPPSSCPVCGAARSLGAHGYYARDTTDDTGMILRIRVRRFLCRRCRRTVSCLPRFAQPYRVVNSSTIDAYFSGDRANLAIERNTARLARYWRRFDQWSARLRIIIGMASGPAPPENLSGFWCALRADGRDLGGRTQELVRDHRITVFGAYVCHRPVLRT